MIKYEACRAFYYFFATSLINQKAAPLIISRFNGHRGSYMSAHVILNLLDELGKSDKYEACRAFYYFFRNKFNKSESCTFNNLKV